MFIFTTNTIKKQKNLIIVIVIPIVFSLLPILAPGKPAKCGYILIVMAVYWITECLPFGVTGLLPALAFPLFEIMSPHDIASFYFQEMVFFMFGSLITSNAIKASGLHHRISLLFFMLIGSDPKSVLFGMMCLTAFVSMWIPNAAAVSMMLPVVNSIIDQLAINERLQTTDLGDSNSSNGSFVNVSTVSSILLINEKAEPQDEEIDNNHRVSNRTRRLGASFMLSCSYSASFGGMCTLVGSSVTIFFKGYMEENYPEYNLGFLNFTLVALPVSFILLTFTWIVLIIQYLPRESWFSLSFKPTKDKMSISKTDIRDIVKSKYESLGPMTFEQFCVAFVFLFMALSWITKDLPVVGGWKHFFNPNYVSDSLPSVLAVLLLFILPKKNIFKGENYEHLLDLNEMETALSWNITLMMGGGFAMAKGFEKSGLADVVLNEFKKMSFTNKPLLLLILMMFGTIGTEFISSVSMAAMYFPLIDRLATASDTSPIFFLVPVSFAISFSYMFAVSSSKNAIVFTGGYVKVKDMLTTGLIVKLFGLIVVFVAANTWLGPIFRLNYLNSNINLNDTIPLIFRC